MRAALAVAVVASVSFPSGCDTADPAPSASNTAAAGDAARRWDPRKVDDLPDAPDHIAPTLPKVVEPPSWAIPLADAPVSAAVVSIRRGRTALLLSADGSWRGVPVPDRSAQVSLSQRGTRLAVLTQHELTAWHLATGTQVRVPFPDRLVSTDGARAEWTDESTILLTDFDGGWLVDADTGSARRVPYPTGFWTVDGAGVVVESADFTGAPVVTDWAGGEPRRMRSRNIGRLLRPVVSAGAIAAVTYDSGPFRVVIADRSNLRVLAALPVRDAQNFYSNGGLSPIAMRDDGIVLLKVAVLGGGVGDSRLVAWESVAGELSLVSRTDEEANTWTSFAVEPLR